MMAGCALFLACLGFVPKRIHLGKTGIRKQAATSGDFLFDIAKTPLEFGVGGTDRAFRIGADMAREIGDSEQQVADLILDRGRVALSKRSFDLVGFLTDFGREPISRRSNRSRRSQPCFEA